MCSNSSLSSGGGSAGCGGENDGYGGGDSVYVKKQKKQRVPKRGPGVAELEKILREQENNNCSSNSLPKSVSFAPPPPILYANSDLGTKSPVEGGDNGRQSGVHVAGSGVFLQEHGLLPTMWDFRQPNVDKLASTLQFPVLLSNGSTNNFVPTTQQLLPLKKISSSSSTASAGPCHGTEPPSNQTPYHYSTLWPDEYEMVGEKRPRPLPMEIPPVPEFRNQFPPFPNEMNILDLAFSFGNNSATNFATKQIIPRDRRGAPCSNFPQFPSPTTPQQERSRFNCPFSIQETNGESHQGRSIKKKPFYSFLQPRDEELESLSNERVETKGSDGIDLNLRL